MVSELPLFLLDVPPSLEEPVLFRFRDDLNEARRSSSPEAMAKLAERYRLRFLPFEQQIRLQFAMLVAALEHVAAYRERPSR